VAPTSAHLTVTDEELITRDGTIIPQALRFDDGAMLLHYHVGFDAAFEPVGMSRSDDKAKSWQRAEPPLHRVAACGQIGPTEAIFFDDNLVHVAGDEYAVLYNRTTDAGRTFTGVAAARCFIPNLIHKPYHADPANPFFPPITDWYRNRLPENPSIGGNMFGRIIRLSDNSLATVCYGSQHGNLKKRRKQGQPASEGIAEQVDAGESNSAILLRSEDHGQTWHAVSVCGKLEPNKPFDGGFLYSEGFNETALIETAPGELFVIMRHGSYHLLWTNRSTDFGKSWQGIAMLNHAGVAPSMTRLGNGALAAAWGRPGLTVAFSLDGSGRYWDVATELMRGDEASQRYPWLTPLDDNTVMVFYDRRTWDKPHPRYINHGIYARRITIK